MLIHASGKTGPESDHTNAVWLTVPDESALLDLSCRLNAAGFQHVLYRDADWEDQAMALGLPEQPREPLRPILGRIQTFKEKK